MTVSWEIKIYQLYFVTYRKLMGCKERQMSVILLSILFSDQVFPKPSVFLYILFRTCLVLKAGLFFFLPPAAKIKNKKLPLPFIISVLLSVLESVFSWSSWISYYFFWISYSYHFLHCLSLILFIISCRYTVILVHHSFLLMLQNRCQ